MIQFLIQLSLQLPLAWELNDDRHGEKKSAKALDVVKRVALGLAVSFVWLPLYCWQVCAAMFLLSMAYHFLLFDYLIVLVLKHYKVISSSAHWCTYLGVTSTTDQLGWWREDPWFRLLVRLIVFILCLSLYVIMLDLYGKI